MISSCCVTGASGFVGRALCSFLRERGCHITALLRKQDEGPWDETIIAELGRDDISPALLDGVEAVFHAAGLVHAVPAGKDTGARYKRINVQGSASLADAALKAGVRSFIYYSSVKAMGDPGEHCVDEDWHLLPGDPYGMSKREAEARVLRIGQSSGMQVTILRPSLVYGAGVKGNLHRMMDAVAKRRFPPLPEVGNKRSMVHVDDLAEAAWLAASRSDAGGQVYIVSDGRPYSTHELFEWMCEAFGRDTPSWTLPVWLLRAGAALGDALEQGSGQRLPLDSVVLNSLLGSACYRSDKIQHDLGWRPNKHFREALPEMVAGLRKN